MEINRWKALTLKLGSEMSEFQPCRVHENLFISGILGVNEANIKARNIRLIIDLTTEHESLVVDGVDTFKIEISDDPSVNIYNYFDECGDRIRKVTSLGHGVLVHCMAGVSRSATICIAYLMKHQAMTLIAAYEFLRAARPQIRPNPGFFEQLIEYEKMLYSGKSTVKMVSSALGRIPSVYKAEQDSPLGYFWPLVVDEDSISTTESKASVVSLQGDSVGSGNLADDEASVTSQAPGSSVSSI